MKLIEDKRCKECGHTIPGIEVLEKALVLYGWQNLADNKNKLLSIPGVYGQLKVEDVNTISDPAYIIIKIAPSVSSDDFGTVYYFRKDGDSVEDSYTYDSEIYWDGPFREVIQKVVTTIRYEEKS